MDERMDRENSRGNMLISVVLCTHNHAERLVRTLEDLGRVEAPSSPWEILAIDNASTDATARLLADTAWRPYGVPVRVVREERLGLSNARNCAIREARGRYLLFFDDDETPVSGWLVAFEKAMLEHDPDALGGRISVLFEHGERPAWLQDDLMGFLGNLDHGEDRWLTDPVTPFYGGNFAVRNDVFSKAGNFDADLGRMGEVNIGGEDTEFYRRLVARNFRVRWVSRAIINHRIRADKLKRSYFLELHYRQGQTEGSRKRGAGKRLPPRYLFGQLARATGKALRQRFSLGSNHSLRLEMNAVYFLGYIQGWIAR